MHREQFHEMRWATVAVSGSVTMEEEEGAAAVDSGVVVAAGLASALATWWWLRDARGRRISRGF